jgi:hypothetical protein
MKYVCLGFLEPGKLEGMDQSDRTAMLDECLSYNEELRKNGHLLADEQLQTANTAVIVAWNDGSVAVIEGPYAETKAQLRGIQVLEARDLNHAIQMVSQSPSLRLGCEIVEIRPVAEIVEVIKAGE